jgi:hypothetical protein
MRRSVKHAVGVGVVGGVAYAVWRAWNARVPTRTNGVEWSTAPFPFPPVPHNGSREPSSHDVEASPVWMKPDADGNCPPTHLIKAKLASGIYHVPGGANYTRTNADRCYADEAAAIADGLRQSKV